MSAAEANHTEMNPASQYCYFFDDDLFEETDRPGFRRRVVVGDHLELWFWRIKGGAEGSFLHNHDANERRRIRMAVYTAVPGVLAYAIRDGAPIVAQLFDRRRRQRDERHDRTLKATAWRQRFHATVAGSAA